MGGRQQNCNQNCGPISGEKNCSISGNLNQTRMSGKNNCPISKRRDVRIQKRKKNCPISKRRDVRIQNLPHLRVNEIKQHTINSMVHCGRASEPGASRLPYYCTPPVIVPAVLGAQCDGKTKMSRGRPHLGCGRGCPRTRWCQLSWSALLSPLQTAQNGVPQLILVKKDLCWHTGCEARNSCPS